MLRKWLAFGAVAFAAGSLSGLVFLRAENVQVGQQFVDECPHDGIPDTLGTDRRIVRGNLPIGDVIRLTNSTPGRIRLSDNNQEIPEFHDCQRFIVEVDKELQYGPLVAIFARDSLQGVTSNTGQGFIAVATIVSWDRLRPDYGPLGIQVGVNCLYMRQQTERWEAFVQSNHLNGDCPRDPTRLPGDTQPFTLAVLPSRLPEDLNPDDIPPVARWDWDAKRNEQYIGIRCGGAWCEVGREGFEPSPDLMPPQPFSTGTQSRVFRVKGWYDRQMLAVVRNGKLVPSGEWGVVVPHPELSRRQHGDYYRQPANLVEVIQRMFGGNALPVAYLYLGGSSYSSKGNWRLKEGLPPLITNVLYARAQNLESPRWLGYVDQFASPSLPDPAHPPTKTFFWRFRPRLTVTLRQIPNLSNLMPHGNLTIPGTARWRWETTDESVWFACPLGCCEAN